jgi:hypothetical protein
MSTTRLGAMRGIKRVRASGPAAPAMTPPAFLGPTASGAERQPLAAGDEKSRVNNCCGVRLQVDLAPRQLVREAESPIGPSPGRQDFRESAERKSRRPPSPGFIGRGCGSSSDLLDASMACEAPSLPGGMSCRLNIGVRGAPRRPRSLAMESESGAAEKPRQKRTQAHWF